jgi:hypothetical protein
LKSFAGVLNAKLVVVSCPNSGFAASFQVEGYFYRDVFMFSSLALGFLWLLWLLWLYHALSIY